MREKRVHRRSCRVRVFDQPQEAERDVGINLGKTDPRRGRQAAMKEAIRFYYENAGDGTLGA